MRKRLIYLDHAASTPMDPAVIEEMASCMEEHFGNPSSVHEAGRRARVLLEQARRKVAAMLHVAPSELFFCSGGTEANNAVLWGCARDLGYKHFITAAIEHPAVLQPLNRMAADQEIQLHLVDIDKLGRVSADHLARLLEQHKPAVVSLMHANNETANLLPVKMVADLCKRQGALFHSDTVQTVGKYHMNMQQLGMDFAVASAHKFHGPKGTGFMIVRNGHFFQPFVQGGGQERNMRAGTENVCAIAGLAKALEVAHERMEEDQRHIGALKEACIRLLKEQITGVRFNGDVEGSSLHTILNISLPAGIDPEMLLPRLDMAGICVSSGSACASGAHRGSHVLTAMGVDTQLPSLRISFSRYNTLSEVRQLVDVLSGIAR